MTQLFGRALGAAVSLTVAFASDAEAQKVRSLRQNDRPIVSRLLPDDEIVLIERLIGPGLFPYGVVKTPETEIRDLARHEELAVIDQPRPQSFFVMNGTWLNTRVRANVVQTLKTRQLQLAPGKVVEFDHEGGELEYKGVILRSAVGVHFENATRYLVAIRSRADLNRTEVVVMFEVDRSGLLQGASRRSGSFPESTLHGLALADVAVAIAKLAQ